MSMTMDLPKCPICYELLNEPVVYPCEHEVCRECFERSIETANLWCPLCRKRFSSWARKNFKNPVHPVRQKQIQQELATVDSFYLKDLCVPSVPSRVLSKDGDIKQEYLQELSKIQEERNEEERRGEAEAHKLLLEEEAELHKRQLKLEEDMLIGYEAAKRLEEQERRREHDQLQEDRRMAELLSQEFLVQQIDSREKQAAEDQKLAERLSKEMEIATSSVRALQPLKSCKFKTPKRKMAIHPKYSSPSRSPSVKPITFWLKPSNQT